MRRNSTHRIAIIRSAALALLALSIFELQILAENPLAGSVFAPSATPGVISQNDDGVVLLFSSLPGAIDRGQTLRVSLANLIRLDGRDQNPVEVRAQVKLFDSQGRIIAQTGEVMVTTNQFRSFDFNRDRLPQPGEERSGRLQVRDELTVRCIGVIRDEALIIRQKVLGFLPASSELSDNSTGGSQAANLCLPMSIWLQAQSAPTPNTFGLAYGQTLRFSALSPNEAGQSGEPIRVRIRLADSHGTVIGQSAQVTIPAGEFHAFDFKRDDLHLPGEPGTGRLQVAWIVEASVQGISPRPFTISAEPLDNTANGSPRPRSRIGYAYQAVPLQQG